ALSSDRHHRRRDLQEYLLDLRAGRLSVRGVRRDDEGDEVGDDEPRNSPRDLRNPRSPDHTQPPRENALDTGETRLTRGGGLLVEIPLTELENRQGARGENQQEVRGENQQEVQGETNRKSR